MTHFAKVLDGIVQRVIVTEQDYIDQLVENSNLNGFKQVIIQEVEFILVGDRSVKKNFAGIGYHYDATADAFYEPQPYPSWTLNTTSYLWECSVAHPVMDIYLE